MTNAERAQAPSVFIHAGRTAFLMAIPVQNNPYKEKPYRDLWDKGYRAAKRQYEGKRFKDRQKAGQSQKPKTTGLRFPQTRNRQTTSRSAS